MCDTCMQPGACCKRLVLSNHNYVVDQFQQPMSREAAEHKLMRQGLWHFMPADQVDGVWRFSCTQLQADGRCGIYENRPQLCRDFAPGSDRLCVHYWAEE